MAIVRIRYFDTISVGAEKRKSAPYLENARKYRHSCYNVTMSTSRSPDVRLARKLSQSAVEVHGRADYGHVRERLGKVAQRLPREPYLVAIEPKMVGVGEKLFQVHPGLFESSGPCQALYEPERTGDTEALFLLWPVLVDEVIPGKLLLDAL